MGKPRMSNGDEMLDRLMICRHRFHRTAPPPPPPFCSVNVIHIYHALRLFFAICGTAGLTALMHIQPCWWFRTSTSTACAGSKCDAGDQRARTSTWSGWVIMNSRTLPAHRLPAAAAPCASLSRRWPPPRMKPTLSKEYGPPFCPTRAAINAWRWNR